MLPLEFDLANAAALVAALLAAIVAGFALRFVWPAWRLGRELDGALRQLAALPRPAERLPDPAAIGRDIFARGQLAHLWREYAQTLHAVHRDESGANPRLVAWRATAMAESFFTEQALVDIPLKTEFYKHLPGILTGLGIIGTFAGLIAGLTHFEVSNDPQTVRTSLRLLIQGVGHAFKVSAAAIALAMLLTWIEKSLVAARYRQVARLVQAIDSLFDAGVGEEYLARLVKASEASAAQGAETGRLIVAELRNAFVELTQRQQEALQRQQQDMATQIAAAVARAVGDGLREPMGRVAGAVEQSGSAQGETMGLALEQALERFNARLDQTFGQRQDGLESLLAQTAVGLQQAVGELRRVAQQLENAGRGTVETAASRLDQAGAGIGQASAAFATTFNDVGRDMQAAIATLADAAGAVAATMADHRSARADFAQMLADLRETVSVARRDAALTGELVSRLQGAAGALAQAEQQAEHYLRGVSAVLDEAHAAFARNVEATLQQGNVQFQRELAAAVGHLRGIVEELGETLGETLESAPGHPAGRV